MLNSSEITEHLLKERLALTAHVFSVARNYHLAEDVFQETCVKAIGREDQFTSREHLLNWFRVSARNRAIDIIRTREGRYVGLSEESLAVLETEWDQVEAARRESLMEALSACMKTLTPRNREIVKLRYFENRSGREIAEYMGRKIGSAYQAVARIHKALGECVRQRMEAEGA